MGCFTATRSLCYLNFISFRVFRYVGCCCKGVCVRPCDGNFKRNIFFSSIFDRYFIC
uniref:Uncharacterized protein n=1 Tax=uncultured marine virus TaxID=186617 RepID=A0A0F7L7M5_9VIRU|nr:hypothetical protein [uncultured marine virus]